MLKTKKFQGSEMCVLSRERVFMCIMSKPSLFNRCLSCDFVLRTSERDVTRRVAHVIVCSRDFNAFDYQLFWLEFWPSPSCSLLWRHASSCTKQQQQWRHKCTNFKISKLPLSARAHRTCAGAACSCMSVRRVPPVLKVVARFSVAKTHTYHSHTMHALAEVTS